MIDGAPSLKQLNRSFVGSVLCVGIAGYAERAEPEQLEMKELFNTMLAEAVHDVAATDRVMVDTGDGAAIAFLGDPEDALFAALSLRDQIGATAIEVGEPGFVRMGIDLGPLKFERGLDGQTNMVGDGVDGARRITGLAAAGQLKVSHSYFDIISRISHDYISAFVRDDTGDTLAHDQDAYRFAASADNQDLTENLRERSRNRRQLADDEQFSHAEAPDESDATPIVPSPSLFATGLRRGMLPLAAFAALLAAAWWWTGKPAQAPKVASVASYSIPPESNVYRPKLEPGKAADIRADVKLAAVGPLARSKDARPDAAADSTEDTTAVPPQKSEVPVVPGSVRLAIQPWGEVYIDGAKRGVSPPMKSISLAPGTHHIEIRNGSFAPHKETIEVKSGGQITIQYVF